MTIAHFSCAQKAPAPQNRPGRVKGARLRRWPLQKSGHVILQAAAYNLGLEEGAGIWL